MGTKDKLIERIKQRPVDFTFDEAKRLMSLLGYDLSNKGKTSGSRVIFYKEGRAPIMLHRPHPENVVKHYAVKQLLETLLENGDL